MASTGRGGARPAHPLPVKIMHWIGATAILCMISSGWAIYNASPSLPFTFPQWLTLGSWLAGGIAWHISVMWVLFVDGLAYLIYGLASGHLRRDIGPQGPKAILHDIVSALTGRLGHRIGHYNAVQRALYTAVLLVICLTVATGLSIWKPTQLRWLVDFFGGYEIARLIHLASMFSILGFLIVHLALVALFPRTLVSMLTATPAESDEASS